MSTSLNASPSNTFTLSHLLYSIMVETKADVSVEDQLVHIQEQLMSLDISVTFDMADPYKEYFEVIQYISKQLNEIEVDSPTEHNL